MKQILTTHTKTIIKILNNLSLQKMLDFHSKLHTLNSFLTIPLEAQNKNNIDIIPLQICITIIVMIMDSI